MTRLTLLPIVVVAIGSLFMLKSIGFFLSDNSPVSAISPAAAQNADAQSEEQMAENTETGETVADEPEMAETQETEEPDSGFGGRPVSETATPSSEVLILQRLGERRAALEKRATELDLREQLLNATELRVERRVTELKSLESRIQVAEEVREEKESDRLKGLVQMYENMKPKDAARVFDRLSLDILVEVVRQIKPRKMSAILAKMSPENAEKLTVAIATDRTNLDPEATPQRSQLPKIEGTPTN